MTLGPLTLGAFSTASVMARRTSASFIDMKDQLSDLQRQLSTGQTADSYEGLGDDAGRSVDLRGRLARLDGFDTTVADVRLRIGLMNTGLESMVKDADGFKAGLLVGGFTVDASGAPVAQVDARLRLTAMLDSLNLNEDGRYLFSGMATQTKPVLGVDEILNGAGGRAGVLQLISERRAADLGTDGMGRLALGVAGPVVTLSEQASGPFGFKLQPVSSTLSNVTVAQPAGAPPSLSLTVSGQPAAGETLSVTLALPDGKTTTITLTARAGGVAPSGAEFQIGATAADTAANIQAALSAEILSKANTALRPASALVAAEDFFAGTAANPPRRVSGSPPNALVAGTASNTVQWYVGDADAGVAARDTSLARVDDGTPLSVGARANEAGFTRVLAAYAAMLGDAFPTSDPTSGARFSALKQVVSASLSGSQGAIQEVRDIQGGLALADAAAATAKGRNASVRNLLESARSAIEVPTQERVIAELLAVQNRLQASYQATATMSKLSLVNFL